MKKPISYHIVKFGYTCATCKSMKVRKWSTGKTHGWYLWCKFHAVKVEEMGTCDKYTAGSNSAYADNLITIGTMEAVA